MAARGSILRADGRRAGVQRNTPIDVLDRVLDKGIMIDAWVRVSLVGIDLITRRGTRSSYRPSYTRR